MNESVEGSPSKHKFVVTLDQLDLSEEEKQRIAAKLARYAQDLIDMVPNAKASAFHTDSVL